MPDGGDWRIATANQNMMGFPAMALDMWSPWLVDYAKWRAQIQEGFGTLASEWQNFVSGRVKEDIAFVQRILQCRTSDQVWAAHAEFWHKAMDDYGREYLLIGKLAGSMTSKAVAAAQSATTEATEDMLHLRKAA